MALDAEVAFIPPAQAFIGNYLSAKDPLGRAAALAKLEGDALQAASTLPVELQAQIAPTINAKLVALLAKAQAVHGSWGPGGMMQTSPPIPACRRCGIALARDRLLWRGVLLQPR